MNIMGPVAFWPPVATPLSEGRSRILHNKLYDQRIPHLQYLDVSLIVSYIGEVLYTYCHCDEKSAERRAFQIRRRSWNQIVYSFEVLVMRQKVIKSQDMGL